MELDIDRSGSHGGASLRVQRRPTLAAEGTARSWARLGKGASGVFIEASALNDTHLAQTTPIRRSQSSVRETRLFFHYNMYKNARFKL